MKKLLWLAPLFALALAVGCQDSPEARKANERAKKEISEAGSATADALRQQKEEYRKKVNADLERLDDQLKTWKEKANQAKDESRVEMRKKIDQLEAQRDKVRAKLQDLKADSKGAWADVKKGLDRAVDDLEDAFDKAKGHFK